MSILEKLKEIVGKNNVLTRDWEKVAYIHGRLELLKNTIAVLTPIEEKQLVNSLIESIESGVKVVVVGSGIILLEDLVFPDKFILVSTRRVNRVEAFKKSSQIVKVSAGSTIEELNASLKRQGFEVALKPELSSVKTMGGIVSETSYFHESNANCSVRSWITSLKIVSPKPRVLSIDSASPYSNLVFGGMGRFGVVVSVEVRVKRLSERKNKVAILFKNGLNALRAIHESLLIGVEPVASEFMGLTQIKSGKEPFEGILVAEFGESTESLKHFLRIVKFHEKDYAQVESEDLFFKERDSMICKFLAEKPSVRLIVRVPIALLTDLYLFLRNYLSEFTISICGNPCTGLLSLFLSSERIENLKKFTKSFIENLSEFEARIISLTTYGCGVDFRRELFGEEEELDLMKVKEVIDPRGVLNDFK